jgi:hypothetical protein
MCGRKISFTLDFFIIKNFFALKILTWEIRREILSQKKFELEKTSGAEENRKNLHVKIQQKFTWKNFTQKKYTIHKVTFFETRQHKKTKKPHLLYPTKKSRNIPRNGWGI